MTAKRACHTGSRLIYGCSLIGHVTQTDRSCVRCANVKKTRHGTYATWNVIQMECHSNVWHSNAHSNVHLNARTGTALFKCSAYFVFVNFAFAFDCNFKTINSSNVLSNAFQMLAQCNTI